MTPDELIRADLAKPDGMIIWRGTRELTGSDKQAIDGVTLQTKAGCFPLSREQFRNVARCAINSNLVDQSNLVDRLARVVALVAEGAAEGSPLAKAIAELPPWTRIPRKEHVVILPFRSHS